MLHHPPQTCMGMDDFSRAGRYHQVMLTVANRDQKNFVGTDCTARRFQLRAGSERQPLVYRQVAQAISARRHRVSPDGSEAGMY
jgi:hypothetical protein